MRPCTVACILLLCVVGCDATLEEEVSATPPLPKWSDFFPPLPALGRRLKVACPCMGVDGCGHALQAMSVQADMENCYDLEEAYRGALTQHLSDMGMDVIRLNLGREAGNLLTVPLTTLQTPVDLLVAGPPCPPWAGQGNKRGCKDARARVFMRVVQWLVYFIYSCGLLAVVLENVVGITHASNDGYESVVAKFVRVLESQCPQFAWRVDVLGAVDYLLPHTRWTTIHVGHSQGKP